MNWATSASYPMGRAAEFALAVRDYLAPKHSNLADVIEYITEAEHQDGDGYWNQFPTLQDALDDFLLYSENVP